MTKSLSLSLRNDKWGLTRFVEYFAIFKPKLRLHFSCCSVLTIRIFTTSWCYNGTEICMDGFTVKFELM